MLSLDHWSVHGVHLEGVMRRSRGRKNELDFSPGALSGHEEGPFSTLDGREAMAEDERARQSWQHNQALATLTTTTTI